MCKQRKTNPVLSDKYLSVDSFSFLNFRGDGDGDVMIKYKTYSSMSRQQQGW